MRSVNRFAVRNDFDEPILLNIEPEGACLELGGGEEVVVIDRFVSHPVTVVCGKSEEGRLVISIWPGDGRTRVEKEGEDVLDLS